MPVKHSDNTLSYLELWDVGNVFVQPKQTLIFSLRSDGRIVSRVDDSGKPNIDLSLTQVPKAKIMIGQIDARQTATVLRQIEKAGVLKANKHSGFITVDGPSIRLVLQHGHTTNEIQHIATDDTKYHERMSTPEAEAFKTMWDKVVSELRTIHGNNWRVLVAEDGVLTEIPWKREKVK